MEIEQICISKKGTGDLVALIFEDDEDIKQIVSDEYDVVIETKDPHECEPND